MRHHPALPFTRLRSHEAVYIPPSLPTAKMSSRSGCRETAVTGACAEGARERHSFHQPPHCALLRNSSQAPVYGIRLRRSAKMSSFCVP